MKYFVVVVLVAVFSFGENQTTVCTLIDVEVLPPGQTLWIAQLRMSSRNYVVSEVQLDDTRYFIDIQNAEWLGESQSQQLLGPGPSYRWAQFSTDPPVLRFVVEYTPGWGCKVMSHENIITIRCEGGRSELRQEVFAPPGGSQAKIVAAVRGVDLNSPLAGQNSLALLRRSLQYLPKDIIRDGLPHFGAVRDDWKGQSRLHKGLDIYVDRCDVLAMADGTTIDIGRGERAGGWIKISHKNGVESVYIHVRKIFVDHGDRVVAGQVIGRIEGPEGNGIEAQLHLEIRIDGDSVDPAILFRDASGPASSAEWQRSIEMIPERIKIREEALHLFRRSVRAFPDSPVAQECHQYRAEILVALGREAVSKWNADGSRNIM